MDAQRPLPALAQPTYDLPGLLRPHAAHAVGKIQRIQRVLRSGGGQRLHFGLLPVGNLHQIEAHEVPPLLQPGGRRQGGFKFMDVTGHPNQVHR